MFDSDERTRRDVPRYCTYDFPKVPYIPGIGVRDNSEPLSAYNISALEETHLHLSQNPFFLYGLDLFNHGYFWEAHESWETIWHLETDTNFRHLLQGLIQLAGYNVKVIQGNRAGQKKLATSLTRYLTACSCDFLDLPKICATFSHGDIPLILQLSPSH